VNTGEIAQPTIAPTTAVKIIGSDPVDPTARTIFFVHHAAGLIRDYIPLAQKLKPLIRPVGIQQVLSSHVPYRPVSIPGLAAHYLDLVETAEPAGVPLIAGHSVGGLIAMQMAHLAHERGRRVGLLLFEPAAPDPPTIRRILAAVRTTRRAMRVPDPAADVDGRLRACREAILATGLSPALADFPPARAYRVLATLAANSTAARRFCPAPLDCPVELFVSSDWPVLRALDSTGWLASLRGAVTVHELPGDHARFLTAAGLEDLVHAAVRRLGV